MHHIIYTNVELTHDSPSRSTQLGSAAFTREDTSVNVTNIEPAPSHTL